MMRLVIFDCDGTLVDSQFSIHQSMRAAWEARGIAPLPIAAVRSVVGLALVECFERLHPELETGEHELLAKAYRAAFAAARASGELREGLYPGCREALDTLRDQDCLLAVATGKSRRGLNAVIAEHGLEDHFCCLKTADDGPSKPHPAILEQALDETGVLAERAIMIGDTSFDMELAANAGLRSIGVSWGYHDSERLVSSGATRLVDHFDEIPEVVGNLLA